MSADNFLVIREQPDGGPRCGTQTNLYTIDESDESWTLDQIVRANEPETFSAEDLERLKALEVGGSIQFGGGAWAEFTIKRVL